MARSTDAHAKRREVVARAAELFEKYGYYGVNLDTIASAVGIRKPTLYHYFSSKEEVLLSIHEEFIDLLISRAEIRATADTASEALVGYMTDILSLMETHRGYVRVFFEHVRELSPEARQNIRVKRRIYSDIIKASVRRGIDEKEFRDIDVGLFTRALYGICNWAYQWYVTDGDNRKTPAEIAAIFFEFLHDGIVARPTSSDV